MESNEVEMLMTRSMFATCKINNFPKGMLEIDHLVIYAGNLPIMSIGPYDNQKSHDQAQQIIMCKDIPIILSYLGIIQQLRVGKYNPLEEVKNNRLDIHKEFNGLISKRSGLNPFKENNLLNISDLAVLLFFDINDFLASALAINTNFVRIFHPESPELAKAVN